MSYTHPRFGLVTPDPQTNVKNLGAELKQLGTSLETILAGFDYNGADPDLYGVRLVDAETKLTRLGNRVTALEAAAPARGSQSIALAGGNGIAEVTVPLPAGKFTAAPTSILLTVQTTLGSVSVIDARVKSRSAASFVIEARKTSTGAATPTIDWVAFP